MTSKTKIISYCNYADLAAVIIGADPDTIRQKLGLPGFYGNCPGCGQPLPDKHHKYCSVECSRNHKRVKVACDNCGRLFEVLASYMIQQNDYWRRRYNRERKWFCSKSCRGQYSSSIGGFGAHPENAALARKQIKWDYFAVDVLLEAGLNCREVAQIMFMPPVTVYSILKKLGYKNKGDSKNPEYIKIRA